MTQIIMYSTGACPYCTAARRLLDEKGVAYDDIRVDRVPERRREMEDRAGRRTVPQIFIDEVHIGGFDELARLEQRGHLDSMLGL